MWWPKKPPTMEQVPRTASLPRIRNWRNWRGREPKRFIDAQKKLLDVAAQQMAVNVKAARKTVERAQSLPAGHDLSDLTRQTVDSFVVAQKALLDVMAKAGHPDELHETARNINAAQPSAESSETG